MSNAVEAGSADATRARDLLARGCARLDVGDAPAALELLRDAANLAPSDARIRSYYGLCVRLGERRLEKASALCHAATKQEFDNPDLYLNLARLHRASGVRS